ncbi:hypothetical protein [uncultured Corynebacterium sp.]|uniref:hypothetical protein n=1 Tax=uncultured Corynebacterium sp. TaxID=159447 RepID=UPI0025932A8B|nr:hypothetical protein [uncultured Corynebacterium sp.]
METFSQLLSDLGDLKDILLGVLAGNGGDVLSTEGSLAGSSGAGEIAGSGVGSVMGSLGIDEDTVGRIPTSWPDQITAGS